MPALILGELLSRDKIAMKMILSYASSDVSDRYVFTLMRTAFHQSLTICLLALLPAVGAAFFHPQRPSWNPESVKEGEVLLSEALKQGDRILWVDARSSKDYEADHIPEAVNLNETEWEGGQMRVFEAWKPDQIVVVYCSSVGCQESYRVAQRLRDAGLPAVQVLKGGWEAWQKKQK